MSSRPEEQSRTQVASHESGRINPESTATPSQGNTIAPAAMPFDPPKVSDEVGTLGPYRIVKKLGQGGMGAVYAAMDTRLDRKLALKVMLPDQASNPEARERFLREARSAARIKHDNVVTLYEADERNGIPYIAMEFLEGYPLDEYLKKKGSPSVQQIIRIAIETTAGLAAAHKLGMVHRDIKPANLWLEAPNGRVKILDFGLARPVHDESQLTLSGTVVGTPAYMSPEQARGLKIDHRSDLFSLGGVMYRLCTGRLPFEGPNTMAILMALGTEEPTPIRQLNPDVPQPLADLVHRLLAKSPDARPQTAEELVKLLRQSAQGPKPKVEPLDALPVLQTQSPRIQSAPIELTALPQGNPFADIDVETEIRPPRPTPKAGEETPTASKKPWLIALGVLGPIVLGFIIIKITNRDGSNTEIKVPDNSKIEITRDHKSIKPDLKKTIEPLPATFKNSLGIEFVKIPRGTGWLGGGEGTEGDKKVDFTDDYYLGQYEVAQEEWVRVMGSNPSWFSRFAGGKSGQIGITFGRGNR